MINQFFSIKFLRSSRSSLLKYISILFFVHNRLCIPPDGLPTSIRLHYITNKTREQHSSPYTIPLYLLCYDSFGTFIRTYTTSRAIAYPLRSSYSFRLLTRTFDFLPAWLNMGAASVLFIRFFLPNAQFNQASVRTTLTLVAQLIHMSAYNTLLSGGISSTIPARVIVRFSILFQPINRVQPTNSPMGIAHSYGGCTLSTIPTLPECYTIRVHRPRYP